MKKQIIYIYTAVILVIVISIVCMTIRDKDNNINNTEQSECLSNTEETETLPVEGAADLNEYGYSNKVIPEGAQVEKLDDGRLRVTLENGIIYQVNKAGTTSMTVAQRREADSIDPKWSEHIDCDADGMTYDDYKERQANGTLTFEDMVNLDSSEMSDEEYEKRVEDGFIYGDKKKDENGATYIVLDDGTIIESGDVLPNGDVFTDSSQW